MSRIFFRKPLLVWVVACGLLALGLQGRGQERQKGPTKLDYSVSTCAECHTVPKPADKDDPLLLCRCDEAKRWNEHDKHKDAYHALEGKAAKEMGELLGYKKPVYEKTECLSCHASAVEDKKFLADGVSCVACHGAFKEWVKEHHASGIPSDREKWRKKSRDEKESKFGMADLWNPMKRTKLCASCHIGNAKEGKFVTHAMYAAGHPPLPGLDVATFSEEMPRHWEYLKEKKPAVQELLKITPEDAEFEVTKLVVVSGLACLRESLDSLAFLAQKAKGDGPRRRSLDLANFDCSACHHELQYPGWRQQRPSRLTAGYPRLREWSLTLARYAIRQAGEDVTQFEAKLDKLYRAFDDRPFGDAAAVAEAADDLVCWLDCVVENLDKLKFTNDQARQVLAELSKLPEKEGDDYDSARARVWAFRAVYSELKSNRNNLNAYVTTLVQRQPFASAACSSYFLTVPKRFPDVDADVERLFAGVSEQVKLRLPASESFRNKVNASATIVLQNQPLAAVSCSSYFLTVPPRELQVLEALPDSLKKANAYDPEKFRKAFSELVRDASAK